MPVFAMLEFQSLLIIILVFSSESYRLRCPDRSQRQLRTSVFCKNSSRLLYTCLYDTNQLSFSEQCNRNPDFVTPGERYVISGNLRNVDCSSKRYQPFRLWSNVSGECLYKKSLCDGEGQVVFNNGSLIEDRRCRCDYTKGYAFIKRPKYNCSCIPSEEDCSCYISTCPDSSVLSSDYECVEKKRQVDLKCPLMVIENRSLLIPEIKRKQEKMKQLSDIFIAMNGMCFLILAYIVLAITIIVFWNRIHNKDIDVENCRKPSATKNRKEKTRQTPKTDINKPTVSTTFVLSKHNNTPHTQANTKEAKTTSTPAAIKPLPTEVQQKSNLRYLSKQLADGASNEILHRNVDQYKKKLESTEEALAKTKLQLEEAVDLKIQIEQLKLIVEKKDRDMEKINKDMQNKEKEMKTNLKKMQDKDSEVQEKEKEIKKQSDEIIRLATERRELHNQVLTLKGNIRVFCRVRPLLKHETKGRNGTIDHIIFSGDKEIKLVQTSDVAFNEKIFTKKGHEKYEFSYDKVFSDKATQEEVFEEISPLVQSALDGFDVCIFAYGQTGSGKTYTMEGTSVNDDDRNRGMIPRAVHQIFQEIEKLKNEELIYSLEVSFLEIYNETIRDLLSDVTNYAKLDIKMAENEKNKNNKKVVVPNLTIVRNPRIEEVSDLLKRASKKRAVGETERNESSSRSHSVFSLTLTSNSTKKIEGTLHLVDLAGSEKFENSASEVQRKETVAINKSLSQLKNVIRNIRSNQQHISYRNSLLTRLLQNSLGGNSKTLMFVNVSPQKECIQETINSLKFAAEVNQCNIGVAKKKR
ncbi:carboxy-terminal kinesin 2-like [Mytilus edulis]|uniref:carboxy-terminal kinesin 2-like n=1 Tax=Mytilus edulis TaxID=6550 RepID=UPI0039EE30AB